MRQVEHCALPGDYEAEVGQGATTLRSEEPLAGSDRWIAMLRRLLRRQMHVAAEGQAPAGVSFEPDAPLTVFKAHNDLRSE
jgi:hypothetical protein